MYQPKLNLSFQPPIQNDAIGVGQLRLILKLIQEFFPEASWWDGSKPTEFNPFINLEDVDDGYPDTVCSLSIGFFNNPRELNKLTYGIWCEDDSFNYEKTDGWEWFEKYKFDADETSTMFDDLNESFIGYKPKLNLRFERGISDPAYLNEILRILSRVYPNLKWAGGSNLNYNPLLDDDFDEAMIYYLTIGYYPNKPDALTYTGADDVDYADEEHHMYNSVDGYGWFKSHDFDADETSAMFGDLSESIKRDWTLDDLKILYDNKVLFYEIGLDGDATKHSDIIGDEVGDILYIGIQDGRYSVCYKLNIEEMRGVEECIMSSEHKIIKWLNDGTLQPTHKFINFDEGEFFEPINENIQPKNLDIEIGDFVIVNGFYEGVLHTTPVKLYFDDDFGKVLDVIESNNRKWYNISFNVLGFNKKASLPNTIWLQNGKDSAGDSFELDITLEHPEELDLDTLFDYN